MSSVRDLYNKACKKGPKGPIQHLFDEDYYAGLEPAEGYINKGDTGFENDRDEWRHVLDEQIAEEEAELASGRVKQSARTQSTVDIDYVATCLGRYKDFSSPNGEGVPLELMAEILQCSWVENPTL